MYARYTEGPAELLFGELGEIRFKRGAWREVDSAHRPQLELPQRVAEYGFECSDTAPGAAARSPAIGLGGD